MSHDTPTDDEREVCLCFHVSLRKLCNYYNRERPRVASQLAECHGAGTGCGWCVPHLERLFEQMRQGEPPHIDMSIEEYRDRRATYHKKHKPMMPPPADADGPIELDLEDVLDDVPDDMKLD